MATQRKARRKRVSSAASNRLDDVRISNEVAAAILRVAAWAVEEGYEVSLGKKVFAGEESLIRRTQR